MVCAMKTLSIQNIIVPIDFSKMSVQAIQIAKQLVRRLALQSISPMFVSLITQQTLLPQPRRSRVSIGVVSGILQKITTPAKTAHQDLRFAAHYLAFQHRYSPRCICTRSVACAITAQQNATGVHRWADWPLAVEKPVFAHGAAQLFERRRSERLVRCEELVKFADRLLAQHVCRCCAFVYQVSRVIAKSKSPG